MFCAPLGFTFCSIPNCIFCSIFRSSERQTLMSPLPVLADQYSGLDPPWELVSRIGFQFSKWLRRTIGLTRRTRQFWCQVDIRSVLLFALVQQGLLNLDGFTNLESTSHCTCSETRLRSTVRQPEYGPEPALALGFFDFGCSGGSARLRLCGRRSG